MKTIAICQWNWNTKLLVNKTLNFNIDDVNKLCKLQLDELKMMSMRIQRFINQNPSLFMIKQLTENQSRLVKNLEIFHKETQCL